MSDYKMTLKITIFFLFLLSVRTKLSITCSEAIAMFSGYECMQRNAVGEGASGKAFLVQLSNTQTKPRILKAQMLIDYGKRERAFFERGLLQSFNHANVIRIFDDKATQQYLYEVIEYGEKGSLSRYIESDMALSQDRIRILRMFRGILQGVRYMHLKGWIHADLKTDNVVVDSHGNPKLIDFDLTVKKGVESPKRGTPEYMELELHKRDKLTFVFDQYVDVYALGIMLYEMSTQGSVPFVMTDRSVYIRQLTEGYYKIFKNMDVEIAYMIHGCIRQQRNARFTIDELISHTDAALANQTPWSIDSTELVTTRENFPIKYASAVEKKHRAYALSGAKSVDLYFENGRLIDLPVMQEVAPKPDNGIIVVDNNSQKNGILVKRNGDSRFFTVLLALLGIILLISLTVLVCCRARKTGLFKAKGNASSSSYTKTVVTHTHGGHSSNHGSGNSKVVLKEDVYVSRSAHPASHVSESYTKTVRSNNGHNTNSSSQVSKTVTTGNGGRVVQSSYQSSSTTRSYHAS